MAGLPGSASSEDALSPRASLQPPLTRHLPSEAWQTHHREHSALRGVRVRETVLSRRGSPITAKPSRQGRRSWRPSEELVLPLESEGRLEGEFPPPQEGWGGTSGLFS